MNKLFKKGLTFFLSLAMAVTMIPAMAATSFAGTSDTNSHVGYKMTGYVLDKAGVKQELVKWTLGEDDYFYETDADGNLTTEQMPAVDVEGIDNFGDGETQDYYVIGGTDRKPKNSKFRVQSRYIDTEGTAELMYEAAGLDFNENTADIQATYNGKTLMEFTNAKDCNLTNNNGSTSITVAPLDGMAGSVSSAEWIADTWINCTGSVTSDYIPVTYDDVEEVPTMLAIVGNGEGVWNAGQTFTASDEVKAFIESKAASQDDLKSVTLYSGFADGAWNNLYGGGGNSTSDISELVISPEYDAINVVDGSGAAATASGTEGKDGYEFTASNGIEVTADDNYFKAAEGEDVVLTAKTSNKAKFAQLTILDEDGDEVDTTVGTDGTYEFTMPEGEITVEAELVNPAYTVQESYVKTGTTEAGAASAAQVGEQILKIYTQEQLEDLASVGDQSASGEVAYYSWGPKSGYYNAYRIHKGVVYNDIIADAAGIETKDEINDLCAVYSFNDSACTSYYGKLSSLKSNWLGADTVLYPDLYYDSATSSFVYGDPVEAPSILALSYDYLPGGLGTSNTDVKAADVSESLWSADANRAFLAFSPNLGDPIYNNGAPGWSSQSAAKTGLDIIKYYDTVVTFDGENEQYLQSSDTIDLPEGSWYYKDENGAYIKVTDTTTVGDITTEDAVDLVSTYTSEAALNGVDYDTFANAYEVAVAGDTITLKTSVAYSDVLDKDITVTTDGGSYTMGDCIITAGTYDDITFGDDSIIQGGRFLNQPVPDDGYTAVKKADGYYYVESSEAAIQDLQDQLTQQAADIAAQQKALEEQAAKIAAQEAQNADQQKALEEQAAKIADQQKALEEQAAKIAAQQEQLTKQDADIAALSTTVATQGDAIAALQKASAEQAETIAEQETKIADQQKAIDALTASTSDQSAVIAQQQETIKTLEKAILQIKLSVGALNPKAKATYNSATVTWNKNATAEGYLVNGETYAADVTTIESTGLKTGTAYTYTVQAFAKYGDETVYGNEETVTVTPKLSKTSLRVCRNIKGKKIKVTWNKVTGAKKYQVSISKRVNGTKIVKTTTKRTFTKGKFTLHGIYYVKVRAIAANGSKGPWSTVEKVKVSR